MADKLLKSIKFPTLPDRYVIGDASLSEEGAAADAKATGDEITNVKSDINDLNSVNFVYGKNIFNATFKNATINSSGVYIPLSTGVTHASTEEYIPVESATDYTLSAVGTEKRVMIYVAEYDSSKSYLSTIKTFTSEYYVPINEKITTSASGAYLRFHCYRESQPWEDLVPTMVQLEKGETATEYHPYGYKESVIEKIEDDIESIYITSRNLFNLTFANAKLNASGQYEAMSTGKSNIATEGYLKVDSDTEYTISLEPTQTLYTFYIGEYTDAKAYINTIAFNTNSSTPVRKTHTFTTSATTKYLRFMVYRDNEPWESLVPVYMQVEVGHIATDYYPYGEVYAVPILTKKINELTDGELPAYYDGYLSGKITDIETMLKSSLANGDAFYFITDMHWDKNAQHSPQIIKRLNSQLRINKCFTGGDITSNGYDNAPLNYIRDAMNEKSKVYSVTGNHEFLNNDTYSDIYYMSSALYNDEVVFGDKEKNYYYLDNKTQKVRYIVLASYGEAVGGAAQSLYLDNTQLQWFTDVALNVESGWTIIIITHCLYAISSNTVIEQPSQSDHNFTNAIKNYLINGNGEIACIIEGHIHFDRIFEQTGMPKVVATTCDKYLPWIEGGVDKEPWLSNRVEGTITEQAFDVVILNKTQRTVSFVRIGCPADDGVNASSGNATEVRTITY